jgi:2-dehydrotetronate isomerase
MPRFSANLGFLWQELPFIERIHAAQAAGFAAVECHWPFDTPAGETKAALAATGLPMLSLNARPGDRAKGEFGLAALSGREVECLASIVEAMDYAAIIGCPFVHVMAGIVREDERDDALKRYTAMLDAAQGEAVRRDITFLIEPLNARSVPGYLLNSFALAEEIMETLGHRNIGLMLDSFHAAMMGHDPIQVFDAYLPWLQHVQFAESPRRGPPEENSPIFAFFKHLDAAGWHGHVGAEYKPAGGTEDSLGWLQRFA